MEWYPRKPQSYRNDTWGLTLAEHGAYCLLIDYYYQSEKPIPCEDRAIASIIGSTLDEWLLVKDAVTRYFHVTNKLLTHSVCDEVIEAQLAKRADGVNRVAKYREKKKTVTRYKRVSNASRGEERRGDSIIDTWEPNEKSFSNGNIEGYTHDEVLYLAEGFKDYVRSKRGKPYADLNAAFYNWIKSDISRRNIRERRRGLQASGNGYGGGGRGAQGAVGGTIGAAQSILDDWRKEGQQ